MERGLLWLPLLIVFFALTWQGYQEYRKVQAYGIWAEQFTKSKYDIYTVLGQKDNNITWGKPKPTGPVKLETFSLLDVQQIRFLIDSQPVAMESPPLKGRLIELEFVFDAAATSSVRIQFTEIPLAAEWGRYLQKLR
jgi:hypothetical protein